MIASPEPLSTYATKAKKIHIEVDPAEMNKNIKVDVPLIGDLREVLENSAAAHQRPRRLGVDQDHRSQQGRGGGARHQEPARLAATFTRRT